MVIELLSIFGGLLRRSSHRATGWNSEKVLAKTNGDLEGSCLQLLRGVVVDGRSSPFDLSAEGVASNAPQKNGWSRALQSWLLRRSPPSGDTRSFVVAGASVL